jgi:tetratricopeptide (TPR) repeat protein
MPGLFQQGIETTGISKHRRALQGVVLAFFRRWQTRLCRPASMGRCSAYNQAVVLSFFLSRLRRAGRLATVAGIGLALALAGTDRVRGQGASGAGVDRAADARGRILLVLPFDNRTGQPSLDWIREAAPEILSSRFASAGFAPMSRADRLYALDHLGLPQGFNPSRASSLKLAQTLDADSIVVGSYIMDGTGIVAEARLVDVPHLRMSEAVTARGDMRNLISVFDSLAWKLTRQLDPKFSVAEETFVAAGASVRVDAFEQFIRGITEPDQAERLRHLKQSAALNADFSQAWMALGREYYNGQQYDEAAVAFGKVGRLDPDTLEAGFYRGLSLLFSGEYAKAENAFGGVARVLPLAEVVNNQGVAVSREGHDGSLLFRQAVAADPTTADYHFNLAVSLKRHGNASEAETELAQCLRLRPNDSEAQALEKSWKEPAGQQVAGTDGEAKADPLERIARSFDAVAFREAALMLDQVDASSLAALTPQKRALKLSLQAKDYLDRGLLLEAERLYLLAVAADEKAPEAHAGLAEVREKSGDIDAARKEAVTSLELMPSLQAYLVMGRLDLAAGHMVQAVYDAGEALKIDPASRAAQELHKQIEARDGQKK